MPFTQPTLTQAQADLANRLNDQNNVRWVTPELTIYLQEAIRTWNAWTSQYREQGSFATTMLQAFYDLPTELPSLRGYSVTTWDMIASLQYALLEPAAAGGTWTGSDQFSLEQLSMAVQRRRDQFLRETGVVLTRTETVFGVAPVAGRVPLDETVVSIRRAAWRDTATQLLQPLTRTTEWSGMAYQPAWPQSTEPTNAYSVTVTPPLIFQLIPPP